MILQYTLIYTYLCLHLFTLTWIGENRAVETVWSPTVLIFCLYTEHVSISSRKYRVINNPPLLTGITYRTPVVLVYIPTEHCNNRLNLNFKLYFNGQG